MICFIFLVTQITFLSPIQLRSMDVLVLFCSKLSFPLPSNHAASRMSPCLCFSSVKVGSVNNLMTDRTNGKKTSSPTWNFFYFEHSVCRKHFIFHVICNWKHDKKNIDQCFWPSVLVLYWAWNLHKFITGLNYNVKFKLFFNINICFGVKYLQF